MAVEPALRSGAGLAHRVLLTAFVLGLGFSISLSETALVALAAMWLWRLRDPVARHAAHWPLLWPVLVFAFVTAASALSSGHAGSSLLAGRNLWLVIALYVATNEFREEAAAERFLACLGLVAAGAAMVGLVQSTFCVGPDPGHGVPEWLFHKCFRARGFFSIYMTLAGVLNIVLLSTLPWALPGKTFRGSFVPVWLIMLGGLITTYTRGAWIGFLAGVLTILPHARYKWWLLTAGFLMVALTVLAGPYELSYRLRETVKVHDTSVQERVQMWHTGFVMWRQHPWLGAGPGGVKREYSKFALPLAIKKRTGHLHNTPLQILVERGLFGLLAWLWIFWAFYQQAIGRLRHLVNGSVRYRARILGSLAAVTGFLVAGLTEYNFGDSEVVMIAWVVMALPFLPAPNEKLACSPIR